MSSITRYIFWQTVVVMVFMTIALSFVIWLSQSLRFVDMIVNRGLPVTDFLWLAILMLPRFLAVILPLSCFVAVVYVYNKLISDRELIVLRAAGFSNLRLARPAIVLALLTSIVVASLNAYLLPVSYRQFTDLKFAIRADYSSILLQEGAFHTLPDGITIFIRERKGAGQLNGILVHDAQDPDRPVTLMAEQGALVQTEEGPRIVLINGNRQEVDRRNGNLVLLYFDKYTVDLGVVSGVPQRRIRRAEEMFLWELLDPSLHPEGRSAQFLAEGHSRLTAPMLSLDFAIIALAFLLSGDFSRRGQANSILGAIVTVVLLQTLAIGLRNLANDDPAVNPFLYVTVAAPAVIGFFFLVWSLPRRRRRSTGVTSAETG